MNCVRKWRIWWYTIIFSFHIEEDAQVKKNNTMWNSITFSVVFRADFLKDGSLTVHRRNGFALRIVKEGYWLCDWRNGQCYILEARYLECHVSFKNTFCTLPSISLLLFKNPFTISSMITNANMILKFKYSKISLKIKFPLFKYLYFFFLKGLFFYFPLYLFFPPEKYWKINEKFSRRLKTRNLEVILGHLHIHPPHIQ